MTDVTPTQSENRSRRHVDEKAVNTERKKEKKIRDENLFFNLMTRYGIEVKNVSRSGQKRNKDKLQTLHVLVNIHIDYLREKIIRIYS